MLMLMQTKAVNIVFQIAFFFKNIIFRNLETTACCWQSLDDDESVSKTPVKNMELIPQGDPHVENQVIGKIKQNTA